MTFLGSLSYIGPTLFSGLFENMAYYGQLFEKRWIASYS